jgi:hypothetical protein
MNGLLGFVGFLVLLALLRWLILRVGVRKRGSALAPLAVVLAVCVPLLTAAAGPADAGLVQEVDPDFWAIVEQFLTLGGFAAFVAILVNILKAVGVVKDGTAGTWAAGINLAGLLALYFAQILAPEAMVPEIDAHLGAIAEILVLVFSYVMQFWVSKGTHKTLAEGQVPVIGKSFSRFEPF